MQTNEESSEPQWIGQNWEKQVAIELSMRDTSSQMTDR